MTCEICAYSVERLIGGQLRFVCERHGYAERVMRFWRRPCYLREPGAEG